MPITYYIGACESWTEEKLANYGGTLTWNSVECSHVYSSVVTEPTCTEDGFTTYTCSVCGDNYVDDTVEKLGHSYQDVVTEPTCLEDGFTTHTCSHCEDSYIDSYVDKLGHDYVGVETPATCTENGYTTYTCVRCEDSYIADYVDASGHSYDAVVTEPTCLEDGYTTFTCIYCEDSYIGSFVEATGHSYESVITAPTCLEQGYTTHICSRCEDSYVDNYTEPTGHSWYYASTVEPTCTKEGITIYCCANCDATNEEPIPMLSSCPTQGYSDVPGVSNWAHEGIDFCITRSIMGSTSTARLVFEPGISCTRSMIVSILYRLSGEPDVTFEAAFPDVKAGQWYSNAVIWAYHNGVVRGYDTGKFGPNDIITREQMAVILKGYTENILQQDTSASTTLNSFADCAKVKWSKDYVSWAVAVGMISGKTQQDGTVLLDPQGNASRSEVASILMRFVQNLVEA